MREKLLNISSGLGIHLILEKIARRRKNIALLFHGVYKTLPHPALRYGDLSMEQFGNVLHRIKKNGYNFITIEEYIEGRPGVLITFDDGFRNNLLYALPVLEQYQAPATFFISTRHITDPKDHLWFVKVRIEACLQKGVVITPETERDFFDGMSADELVQLASHPLVTIGGHTVNHPWLSRLTEEEQRREISECKTWLSQLLGYPIKYFAYPIGDYSATTISVVKEYFDYGFAVDPFHRGGPAHYEITRTGIYSDDPTYLALKFLNGK